MHKLFVSATLYLSLSALAIQVEAAFPDIERIASEYVKLLLFTEQYDDDIVDAYYGPERLKPIETISVPVGPPPFDSLANVAGALLTELEPVPGMYDSPEHDRRYRHLAAQLRALHTRLRILNGENLPYDTESKLIYDVVVPSFDDTHFDSLVSRLDSLIPGEGELFARWREYGDRFIVPEEKQDTILKTAIEELRRRTLQHFTLPVGERFDVEFVNNVSWGAYNWYLGDYKSLIQYNADSPLKLTSAIGLAAHEGYPGHHVAGVVQDSILFRQNGWIEFSIVPLFSPTSIFSEGLASFAVELAFPREERIRFESEVLSPLAGIDSTGLGLYWELTDLFDGLDWVSQIACRDYLDGRRSYDETIAWLSKYSESSQEGLERTMKFTEQYRAYRVTYKMGEMMVRDYMNRHAPNDPDRRWELFWQLYTTPAVPSDLNPGESESKLK